MYILVHILWCTCVHISVEYIWSGIADHRAHLCSALVGISNCLFFKVVPTNILSSSA